MTASARQIALVAAVAGVAFAIPAAARPAKDRIDCPEMPTSNDTEGERSGGFGLAIGGIEANLDRSRSHANKDVMMRSGKGWEDWSASAVLAHSCQVNRLLYANDLERQRDEFAALRERLIGRPQPQRPIPTQAATPYRSAPVKTATRSSDWVPRLAGFPMDQIWQPLPHPPAFPWQARQAGVRSGSAVIACWLTHAPGAQSCQVESESPAGHGFGAAGFSRTGQMRLREEVRRAKWADQWVRIKVQFKDTGN